MKQLYYDFINDYVFRKMLNPLKVIKRENLYYPTIIKSY